MNEEYIASPEIYGRRKLNALYREIPLKDNTFRTLRKYFSAMANLYGIITIGKAYEIISSQSPKLVTQEEFLAFVEIARHECDYYSILRMDEMYIDGKAGTPFDWELIDSELLFGDEEEDPYSLTKENQQGKPYYIPGKQELLRYADTTYWEKTPEAYALRDYFSARTDINVANCALAFIEIVDEVRYFDPHSGDMWQYLGSLGIDFSGEKDTQNFMEIYQNFHNNSRMQCNRGHTPLEVRDMMPPQNRGFRSLSLGPNIRKSIATGEIDPQELFKQVLTMEMPDEELRMQMLRQIMELGNGRSAQPAKNASENPPKSISRNDLCPCGSGKKYKKCCGMKH